jgi:hypothetical protein
LIGLVSAPDNVITEARFKLSKRWTQTVVERYSITITAPNSIEYIGTMSEEKNIAIASDYENKDWSINPYSSVSADATQDDVGDFVIDTSDDTESSGNRDDADAAQEAIISYCRSQIIGSHRNNTVSFQVPFHPLVNLSHTVKCTSSELTAKGKVRQVVDEFNIDTGDASTTINLAISAHGGTGIVADYPPEAVEPPSADGTVDEYDNDRLLQTYVGGLASSLPYNEEWEGYIVNSDNTYVTWFDGYPTAAAGYEYYPIEGVVIKTSEISGNAIESLDVQQTASLTVDIPQDTLTLNA